MGISKCCIYARLSREDEDKIDGKKESRSIENQIKELSNFALEHGFEIYKIYYDDGYTGANFDRPQFQEMLKDMNCGKFKVLIIKDISRLGRSLHKVGDLIDRVFPELGLRVISVSDKYDSLNYDDEMSIVLKNFLNEYYLRDFRKKCKNAREQCARTKHMNYYPIYGYNFDLERKEIIDEYSANIVRYIFKCIGEDRMSTCQVANKLNEMGVKTRSYYQTQILGLPALNKNFAKKWDGEKVWEIAKNYEYCGHSVNLVSHRNDEIIILRNTHLAIIDEDLFIKAQDAIASKSTVKNRIDHLGRMLLDKETGKHLLYYNKKPYCYFLRINQRQAYKIRSETIEKIILKDVLSVIKQCKLDNEKYYGIIRKRLFGNKHIPKQVLETRLLKLNEEYAKYMELWVQGKITESMYKKNSEILINEIRELENKKNIYEESIEKVSIFDIKFKKFLESINDLPVDPKEIIRMAVSKVIIRDVKSADDFKIKIVYKFEEI